MVKPTSYEKPRYVVLLTACISPKAGVRELLTRVDTHLRLQDYRAALESWLNLPDSNIGGIIFADNSGYPLKELEEFVNKHPATKPVEFLSFDQPPPERGLHYGQTEFLLINAALSSSRLAQTYPFFIKATGRYRFPDVSKLLRHLPADYRIAVDCRASDLRGVGHNGLVNVALFAARRDFFLSEFAVLPSLMQPAPPWNRRQFVENVFFDLIYPKRGEAGIVLRWPCSCEPLGVGANGDDFSSNRKRLKRIIRSVLRHLAPSLWL